MLLHMQMYPEIENARKMMTFLIHNPDRFATDMLIWPGMVVFLKVVTTVGAQVAAVQAMLQTKDELTTIKWYASAIVIASLDEKLLGIVANMYGSSSEGTIEDKPLELGVHQYQSSKEAIVRVWTDLAEKKGRITIGDCIMVTFMAILN